MEFARPELFFTVDIIALIINGIMGGVIARRIARLCFASRVEQHDTHADPICVQPPSSPTMDSTTIQSG